MLTFYLGGLLVPLFFSFYTFAQPDLEKGRRLYMANCIQCHNRDPHLKGPLGPDLVGTPIEVMQVKVETGRYPEKLPAGYVPKRKTKAMRKLPHVVKDVPSIYAWINSVKKK